MNKKDEYLLFIYKLKNVIRYNSRNHLKNESVAEHSFYVALITLKLCDEYDIDMQTTLKCLIKAILHDMPESELNDITHDVKVNLKLYDYLKPFEDEYFKEHFPEHVDVMLGTNELVDTIVDLADVSSVYQYVLNETILGNLAPDISEIKSEAIARIKKLEDKLQILLGGTK